MKQFILNPAGIQDITRLVSLVYSLSLKIINFACIKYRLFDFPIPISLK